MKLLKEVLTLSSEFLEKKGIVRSKRVAEDLLASLLKFKRLDLYLNYDRPIEEKELSQMRESVLRVSKNEPVEYVLGSVEFLGIPLKVDQRVLIPRPETEILAEKILNEFRGKSIWDICTGSGCLAIALKKKREDLEVAASDLSQEALDLAKENAKANGVNISFYQGDLLMPFLGKTVDGIVSNPPYISQSEYETLDVSVKSFEPKEALVGGEDGLFFYRQLEKQAKISLNPGGSLFLEIGYNQERAVQEIFSDPLWVKKEVLRDWADHPRFFFLEKQVDSRVSFSE